MQPAQLNVPDWIHWNVKLPPRPFGFQSPNGEICKPTKRAALLALCVNRGVLPASFNAAFPAPTMRGQVSRLYALHLSALARHLRKRASCLPHIDAVSHTWRDLQSSPDRILPPRQTVPPCGTLDDRVSKLCQAIHSVAALPPALA